MRKRSLQFLSVLLELKYAVQSPARLFSKGMPHAAPKSNIRTCS